MLLSDFFETVYLPRRLRGKSENSIRLYRLCIKQFSRSLGRPARIADLTNDNLLAHLTRRSCVSAATRNKELAELTALWRLAVQRGMHEGWPDIQPEPEPERTPIAWMSDELQRLFRAAKRRKGHIDKVPAGRWWYAFLRVILDTGERMNAVRQAEKSWLNGEWIIFPAEVRKGKTRDKSYRLSPETLSAIRDLEQFTGGDDRIFPWPYCASYIWQLYKGILRDAGLPVSRKHKFHTLRKTHGSVLYAAGLDPQDSLDHSDRRTTQRYIDPRFTRDRAPCDVLADWLAKPKAPQDDRRNRSA